MKRYSRSLFDRYIIELGRRMYRPIDYVAQVEVDFTKVIQARLQAKAMGENVSIGAILVKAVSVGLHEFPLLRQIPRNADYWIPETVRLGVPVDSDISNAFAVPIVLEDAHLISLKEATRILQSQSRAVREGEFGTINFLRYWPRWMPVALLASIASLAAKISPKFNSKTFCVPVLTIVPGFKSLSVAVSSGGPVISIGEIKNVAEDCGENSVIPPVHISCSIDHRVANGRYAAQFLKRIRQCIEIDLVNELQENCIGSRIGEVYAFAT